MARITVEDCLKNVKNRFELILVASKRARELMLTGTEPTVAWKNDKSTVVALREIAKGTVSAKILESGPVVRSQMSMSRHITEQDIREEVIGDEMAEEELFSVADEAPVDEHHDEA